MGWGLFFAINAFSALISTVSLAFSPVLGTIPACSLNDHSPDLPLSTTDLSKLDSELKKEEILTMGISEFCKSTAKAETYKSFTKLSEESVRQLDSAKTPNEEAIIWEKFIESDDRFSFPFSSQEELDQTIATNLRAVSSDAWQNTLYPDSRVRKVTLDQRLGPQGQIVKWQGAEEVKAFFSNPKKGFATVKDRIRSPGLFDSTLPEDLEIPPDQASRISTVTAKALVICSKYTMRALSGCVKAIEKISTELAPRGSNMALPVVMKVLRDPSYQKGASIFALKIMERVEKKDSSGDLLNDLTESYVQAGLNKVEAEEYAWNFIGTWATRGGNTYKHQQFAHPDAIKTLLAMDIMSAATPYLDQLRIENNQRPYSYPPSVDTKCSYGKSYHFWMSAFLTRRLGKELGSPEGAMTATYLAELGYQMLSQTTGRDPSRAFMVDSLDPVNNKMRLDVAFGAAGAVFGRAAAEGSEAPTLKIDSAIEALVNHAGSKEPLSKKDAAALWEGLGISGYNRWMSIFNPDVALNLYLKANK